MLPWFEKHFSGNRASLCKPQKNIVCHSGAKRAGQSDAKTPGMAAAAFIAGCTVSGFLKTIQTEIEGNFPWKNGVWQKRFCDLTRQALSFSRQKAAAGAAVASFLAACERFQRRYFAVEYKPEFTKPLA
ncbi:hypothetical protein [Rhizobium sp. RM]|uniref:hypothetical protein n=1 Tax=Rhizobium sp. RM TaxID=2748079 RepID=UPI0015B42648|nr:hypothetical protein [Rhizobium sp. RM]NWJ26317.1 hypothetical protein [Rhizobium sp. RM]